MDSTTRQKILTLAEASPVIEHAWHGRGLAPRGYVKGMALVFGRVYENLLSHDPSAALMAQKDRGDPNHDALNWFLGIFRDLSMSNAADGPDTLRHLWTLQVGLGMRESSGQWNMGRDMSARNVSAVTAEAGLFQQSWGSHGAHPELDKIYASYSIPEVDGFLSVFREGVDGGESRNWGSGPGATFQHLAKVKPAFACEFAALGLRYTRGEWGPIDRREAEVLPAVEAMLRQVQGVVDAAGVAPTVVAPAVVLPPTSLLDPERIAASAIEHGAEWAKTNGLKHVFYVEGCNLDGSVNNNAIDRWNDVRGILEFSETKALITFLSRATTEPGIYYDKRHVINAKGAALIDFGFQTCWQIGTHMAGHADAHEALCQTGGEVRVYRDYDHSFRRQSGHVDVGMFGINHHSTGGNDADPDSVGPWSAGCLVVPQMVKHRQFMSLLKQDQRWLANRSHIFGVIVMPTSWVK